jgi:hypothetical protein
MQSFSDAEQILIGLAAFSAGCSYEEWLAILQAEYPHRQQQLAHCHQILQDRMSAFAALATAQQPLLADRWDGSVASSEPAEHIQRSIQLQRQQQLQQQHGQHQPTPRPAGLRSVIRVARTPDTATSGGHSPFLQPQLQQTPRPGVQIHFNKTYEPDVVNAAAEALRSVPATAFGAAAGPSLPSGLGYQGQDTPVAPAQQFEQAAAPQQQQQQRQQAREQQVQQQIDNLQQQLQQQVDNLQQQIQQQAVVQQQLQQQLQQQMQQQADAFTQQMLGLHSQLQEAETAAQQ